MAGEHIGSLWRLDLDDGLLTRTDGISGRREAGIVHHSGELHLEHLTVAPRRAGVDPGQGRNRGAHHDRRRAGLLPPSTALLHAGKGVPSTRGAGRRVADGALAQHTRRTASPSALRTRACRALAESRTLFLLHREGSDSRCRRYDVHDALGKLLGRVDFLWPKHAVFLEFDGRIKYEIHRRPGESLGDYLMREKRREERICQETGWICIRIGWADLEDPHGAFTSDPRDPGQASNGSMKPPRRSHGPHQSHELGKSCATWPLQRPVRAGVTAQAVTHAAGRRPLSRPYGSRRAWRARSSCGSRRWQRRGSGRGAPRGRGAWRRGS